MDLCSDICSTAKKCMSLDQHRNFARCNLDLDVLSGVELDPLLSFAWQVLNPSSSTT